MSAEQVLVAGVGGGAGGEPPAELEPPHTEVRLEPETDAGGRVVLSGRARDGGHGPSGHPAQLLLLAPGKASRPKGCTILKVDKAF